MASTTAERLRELCAKHDLEQDDVATIAGYTQPSASRWLSGTHPPPADAVARLARHFNVTSDYILGLSDFPGLAPDTWIVDDDLVEAIRAARSYEDVLRTAKSERRAEAWAAKVPRHARIVEHAEYDRLRAEVEPRLEALRKRRRGSRVDPAPG